MSLAERLSMEKEAVSRTGESVARTEGNDTALIAGRDAKPTLCGSSSLTHATQTEEEGEGNDTGT